MSAQHNPTSPTAVRGVNVIVRRDGSELHIDDIETTDQGRAILDEIDASILSIEDQLENSGGFVDENWRRRATAALRKKRRIRPALQQRIADLRRSERIIPPGRRATAVTSSEAARPQAFVAAAEQLLDREVVTEIWGRAAKLKPSVFEAGEGSSL